MYRQCRNIREFESDVFTTVLLVISHLWMRLSKSGLTLGLGFFDIVGGSPFLVYRFICGKNLSTKTLFERNYCRGDFYPCSTNCFMGVDFRNSGRTWKRGGHSRNGLTFGRIFGESVSESFEEVDEGIIRSITCKWGKLVAYCYTCRHPFNGKFVIVLDVFTF